MANREIQPERKKSRFFSGGKSKIESLLRGKKRRKLDDNAPVDSDEEDDEAELPTPPNQQNQYASAARSVRFAPIGRNLDDNLAGESQDSKHMSVVNPDWGTGGTETNKGNLGKGDGRRNAVYGAQSIGLAVPGLKSVSAGITPHPAVVVPPRLQINRPSHASRLPTSNPPTSQGMTPQVQTNNTLPQLSNSSGLHQAQLQPTPTIQPSRMALQPPALDLNQTSIQNSFDPFASISNAGGVFLRRGSQPTIAGRNENGNTNSLLQGRPQQSSQPSSRLDLDQTPSLLSNRGLPGTVNAVGVDPRRGQNDQPSPQHPRPASMNSHIVPLMQPGPPLLSTALQIPVQALGKPVPDTRLDLDRDAAGILLPIHLRRFASTETPKLSSNPTPKIRPSTTPANFYTSPKRIEHAIETSRVSLKRKRPGTILAPPAYIYSHSGDPNFNIFANGFLLYPELCITLAGMLPLRDLIGLYAISKDFHTIIDSRFTTTCLSQVLRKAPQSAQTYPFRSYEQYCRTDPVARLPHPDPSKAALHIARKIPSFRWVAFVLHREKVVHELITIFAERGCPLPARCSLALKRMWTLMDVPDNARRIAMIHNHRLFTDLDLYFLMCFFVKLDMVANDPVATQKRDGLRELLLQQRGGLDVIHKVLKREMWKKKSDFLKVWVEYTMNLDSLTPAQLEDMKVDTVFGVPKDQVGLAKYEYWGLKGVEKPPPPGRRTPYLLRPDQLVMREAIRRNMEFTKHFLRCLMYGYVRPDTLENYEPRQYGRRIERWSGEEYEADDDVGNLRAVAVEDGGDILLDLGNTRRGSPWTVKKEEVSKQEKALRVEQESFLEGLYESSQAERVKGRKAKSAGSHAG